MATILYIYIIIQMVAGSSPCALMANIFVIEFAEFSENI